MNKNEMRRYKNCDSMFTEVEKNIDDFRERANATASKLFGRRHLHSDEELRTSKLSTTIRELHIQAVVLLKEFTDDEDVDRTLVQCLHAKQKIVYEKHAKLLDALHDRRSALSTDAAKLLVDVAVGVSEATNVLPFGSALLRKIAS